MGYMLAITVWRDLATLLAATFWLRDVEMIFVTLICAEALKNLWIYAGSVTSGLLVFRDRERRHARAGAPRAAPLGAGSVLYKLNDFGQGGGGQSDGPCAARALPTGRLPGATGEHRAGCAGGRDLPDMVKRSKKDPSHGLLL